MSRSSLVSFERINGYSLFFDREKGISVPAIIVDQVEKESVRRASDDFRKDWERVTDESPRLLPAFPEEPVARAIVVGTVGTSPLLQQLVDSGKLDVTQLNGKWESYSITYLENAVDAVHELIVIAGSDPRGAIFGMYDLSEQLGVSPWYWWMDVPVQKQERIYLKQTSVQQGEPSVKYRGFFINDEGPSLMTWVRKNHADFTADFYEKVFELTLRLKANYHWPAMWDSSFYEDDEKNAATADRYGVVMGTSHHEPMARPHEDWKRHRNGAWDYEKNGEVLYEFWDEGIKRSEPYENIITIGMRGDGDEAMETDLSFEEKMKLMEKIIADQREIISRNHQKSAEEVPQLWALYKEVMDYYEAGLRVPDDVTLLWSDDNFGNLRRVPTAEERMRTGGAGIYYHLDYVGGPRSYKWVNTVPLQKIWEQMQKAYRYGADRIWILNVGDIKPMEFQMTFFLKMAWNMDDFTADSLEAYTLDWATATFGKEYAEGVAAVITGYSRMNGKIKPEHLNGGPLYALNNHQEAERELAHFEKIVQLAETLLEELPEAYRDAFFQVGYYPAKASYHVLKMYVLAALNQQYAEEGRIIANRVADQVEALFEEDKLLTFDYHHRNAFGKWNHMMSQTHIGYTYWQQPETNQIPATSRFEEKEIGELHVAQSNRSVYTNYSNQVLYFELYNTGLTPVPFEIEANVPWINVSEPNGWVTELKRIPFEIDFEQIEGRVETTIQITSEGKTHDVPILAERREVVEPRRGHIETDDVLSIEAAHYSEKQGSFLEEIPHYGRTESSMALLVQSEEVATDWEEKEEYPSLRYDFYLFEPGEKEITLIMAPFLDYVAANGAPIGLQMDEEPMTQLDTVSRNGHEPNQQEWEETVIVNARIAKHQTRQLEPGWHTLTVTFLSPEIVLQKIIMDNGKAAQSFLGAPESIRMIDESSNVSAVFSEPILDPFSISTYVAPKKETITVQGTIRMHQELEKQLLQISVHNQDERSHTFILRVSPEPATEMVVRLEKEQEEMYTFALPNHGVEEISITVEGVSTDFQYKKTIKGAGK
ncbi:glycosyl hydrolase 115 family protein [Jeotgalibaca caeni]|uniref:glycosyl hydrolase 115 family protein n=1 Tax=Jeotgalibaca caeni TaxID=3028623 RepID=UPI00237D33C3|nr:glycosyl hydrolase 115 family protein [Jeotgalibaca caeni]MDE1548938.1 glycosyl hydrolase 115 family protein [Jeotgalibaca caeni]